MRPSVRACALALLLGGCASSAKPETVSAPDAPVATAVSDSGTVRLSMRSSEGRIVRGGDGRFKVDRLYLYMPGRWELRVAIGAARTDSATLIFDVE